jgi:hypothetical protein
MRIGGVSAILRGIKALEIEQTPLRISQNTEMRPFFFEIGSLWLTGRPPISDLAALAPAGSGTSTGIGSNWILDVRVPDLTFRAAIKLNT